MAKSPLRSPLPADDDPSSQGLNRRSFLKYVGAGAGAIFGGSWIQLGCAPAAPSLTGPWVRDDGMGNWHQPPYPVPLPGSGRDRPDAEAFASYEVVDDLVLPDGFHYRKLAEWGRRFGPADAPERQIRFGYNNDYTGLQKIDGSDDEYWLLVNHEYVAARPWLEAYAEVYGQEPPKTELVADTRVPMLSKYGIYSFDGYTFPLGSRLDMSDPEAVADIPPATLARMRSLAKDVLNEMGVSVLRVKRLADGHFEVIHESPDHKRITAIERQNVDGEAEAHSRFTGPADWLFTTPPRGTMSNCSGGNTPWGTFLTCEENFQNDTLDSVSPEGLEISQQRRWVGSRALKVGDFYDFSHPLPFMLGGNGHLIDHPLDSREYGWVCEVDPASGHLTKHTALGRFRHENVTVRAEAGRRLAAYMGDDRRGGHIWKFVSDEVVDDPQSAETSNLLSRGTLYVARFNEDFTGEWVPLDVETPLRRPEPEHCFSQHMQVPSRFVGGPVKVGNTDRDNPEVEVEDWMEIISNFAGKPFDQCTLGDLVRVDDENGELSDDEIRRRKNGILSVDAFLMANACGGTPSARPEDLEIHPDDRTVYIAFTDATDSSDGSPDQRIFPDSSMETSRQYGAIYRILEGGSESPDSDPASTTFKWGKFVSSGEVAEQGGGFACADNMVFDPAGNLWMVTDISTSAQNFPTSRQAIDGTLPGGKNFPGVFGNNAMFMLPTRGDQQGLPQLFAIAPMEAELCGPTFADDGEALILSIQHPGESDGTRRSDRPDEENIHIVHDRDDQPFEQRRTVPVGSNFPHGEKDRAPRPCVVCVTRST